MQHLLNPTHLFFYQLERDFKFFVIAVKLKFVPTFVYFTQNSLLTHRSVSIYQLEATEGNYMTTIKPHI